MMTKFLVCGLPQEHFNSFSQLQDVKDIRLLHTFGKPPSQKYLSCTWDGFYSCVALDEEVWTISEGRWKKYLEAISKHTSEKIAKIWDMGSDIVFKTVKKRMFLCNHKNEDISEIKMESPIASLHSVDNKFCILCEDSSVYFRTLNTPLPGSRLFSGRIVKDISCGSDHILLLEDGTGRVWSMGQNLRGQLGHGDLQKRTELCVIEALDGIKVTGIASGAWHNLVLSEFGDLYSWGWNAHGQLGLPATTGATSSVPCLIPMEELEFCRIGCGSRHSVTLTKCGKLLSWGWNGYGQLGRAGISDRPAEVCVSDDLVVSWVSCGPWNTFIMGTSKEKL